MMGRQSPPQEALWGSALSLDERIPQDHVLRKLNEAIDFDFVYREVSDRYGAVGHESVPPPVILKLLVLLTLYNVRSERELMATLPLRLDWLWFTGYQLDEPTPGHSVLSKARRRWGVALFETFFERIVEQCIDAGLVDGSKIFVDSSLVDANASIDSLFKRAQVVAELHDRLEEPVEDLAGDQGTPEEDSAEPPEDDPSRPQTQRDQARYVSSTDPDATGTKRGKEKMRPRYATHRAIDQTEGVITATHVGPGHENEAEHLEDLIDQHQSQTNQPLESVTADSKYGTHENLKACQEREITPYIQPYKSNYGKRKGMFGACEYRYDPTTDTYLCPAGQRLTRGGRRHDRNGYRYVAPKQACASCPARHLCTKSKSAPRSIVRPDNQDLADAALKRAWSTEGVEQRKQRFWMMEGSFAQSTRFGHKRARWRGQWRVQIQALLIATVQNALILIRRGGSHGGDALESVPPGFQTRLLAFLPPLVRFISLFFRNPWHSRAHPFSPT